MTTITPEECEKLWDWLVETLPVGQVAVFEVHNETTTIHTVRGKCGIAWWINNDDAVPEKIRRALAVKGIVERKDDVHMILIHCDSDRYCTTLKVDYDNDKTQKHALMRATLNLIGG